jgi:nicotinamidase-related amidase
MLASPDQSVLLIIDMQSKLMPAIEDHAHVLSQCIRLAKIAKQLDIPIIGTEENPAGLGENHPELKALCQKTVTKFHFDGCSDDLISHIPTDRKQLVLVGCEAHVCLMQTALGLLEHGFVVSIAVDAIGSRQSLDKTIATMRLKESGATLKTVEMLAFEWLKTCKHRGFKNALALIK